MVETAISMLVFVPVLLYALTLDDLLRYKLNLQETVGAAVWDTTTVDYEKGDSNAVGYFNQMMYCDHTAAYDSYDKSYECEEAAHHAAVGSHQCWLVGGAANQVMCDTKDVQGTDRRMAATSYTDPIGIMSFIQILIPSPKNFAKEYQKGGFQHCRARLGVLNYLLMNEFLQEHSEVKLNEKKDFGDADSADVHGDSGGASTDDAWVFPFYHFSVMTDTWALNQVQDIGVGEDRKMIPIHSADSHSKNFHKRTEFLFRKGLAFYYYSFRVIQFLAKAWSNELLMPGVVPLMTDDPTETYMSVKHGNLRDRAGVPSGSKNPFPKVKIDEEWGSGNYYASPWQDWDDDPYKATYDARGKYYMGCTQKGC